NMALTLEAVVAELDALDAAAGLADVAKAVGHGSLMGARGNSGVILSQLLRGLADRFGQADRVGPHELADGLRTAAGLAEAAVVRPVEGTILTVARAAGEGGTAGCGAGADLLAVTERARAAAAVARTPEMLEVLARAGVVDAGGAGYLLLLDALLSVLDGRPLPDPPEVDGIADAAARPADEVGGHAVGGHAVGGHAVGGPGGGHGGAGDVGDLRYEVMYLLHAPDDTMAAFKEVWAGIGDSIVV